MAAETREPARRQPRLRSRDLRRGGPLRGRGHAVEHDAARLPAADQDHQHPEHEGPRRDRRHRLPQEHRLRQLLERGAHPLRGASPTPIPSWARWPRSSRCARGRCSRSWTACAGSGTAGRSRGRASYVFYPKQIFFGTDPGRDRPPAPRHHRRGAEAPTARSRSGTARRSTSRSTTARARDAGSQRQHHHPRARPRGVREPAFGLGVADMARIKVQDIVV
mgnify:CR=1 FL=1